MACASRTRSLSLSTPTIGQIARRTVSSGCSSAACASATIGPTVSWLTADGLLALLNCDTVDFLVRTFLGSRMQIEIGDIRRLPIPVLTPDQATDLDSFGRRATTAKEALDAGTDGEPLTSIEAELDTYTRNLYGLSANADLWVVR